MILVLLLAASPSDADVRDAVRRAAVERGAWLFAEEHRRAPVTAGECVPFAPVPEGIEVPGVEVSRLPEWLPPLREPADAYRRLEVAAAAARALRDALGRLPTMEEARAALDWPALWDRVEFQVEGTMLALRDALPPAPNPDESRPRFDAALPDLRSPDYATREGATSAIVGIGPAALPWIDEALRGETDEEARARLETARAEIRAAANPADRAVVFVCLAARRPGPVGLAANERAASACLRSIMNAEETLRSTDAEVNGANDYWTSDLAGLYYLSGTADASGSAIHVIRDAALAAADVAPARGEARGRAVYIGEPPALPTPKGGYFFLALPSFVGQRDEYGYSAFPAEYGVTGRYTYLMAEDGTIFRADTRGRPVLEYPSDADLSAYWSAVQ